MMMHATHQIDCELHRLACAGDMRASACWCCGSVGPFRRRLPAGWSPANFDQAPSSVKRCHAVIGERQLLRPRLKVRRVPQEVVAPQSARSSLVAVAKCVTNLPDSDLPLLVHHSGKLIRASYRARLRDHNDDSWVHAHDYRCIGVDRHRRSKDFAVRSPADRRHRAAILISAIRLPRHTAMPEVPLAAIHYPVCVKLASIRRDPHEALVNSHEVGPNSDGCPSTHTRPDPRLVRLLVAEAVPVVSDGQRAAAEHDRCERKNGSHQRHALQCSAVDAQLRDEHRGPHRPKSIAPWPRHGWRTRGGNR